jgi:nitrogen fixation NifU-like protein
MDSASCIDDIHLYVLMQGDFISDICFDGIGCAISTASTSILTELIMGKTRKEALHIIQQYEAMIFEQPYEEDSLEEAVVFRNTSKQANRIKCATIGWDGLKRLLHE